MSVQLPIHLEGLSKAELEGMCHSCGICCQSAVPVAKGVNALIPELRCKYLVHKGESGETCCSVYEDRFEKAAGWCVPLAEGIQKGIFPNQCPYVSDMKDYVGKVALSPKSYALVEPQIRKTVIDAGMPDWVKAEDWHEFVKGAK